MATFYSAVAADVKMALRVTETSTDVNSNSSTVSWALIGWLVGSNWYSNNSHDISVAINGATVFSRASGTKVTISIGTDHTTEANPVTIASGTATIPHNADGSKTLSVSFSCAYKWVASSAWSASGTMALTQIARASQPSCITYPATTENIGYMGDTIYIHTNRASASFTHTLRYVWGSKSGTIATGVGDNTKWTIPLDLATEIPSQYSGWGSICCDTYYGNTFVGTKSVVFKASAPSSTSPAVSISLERPRTTTPAVTGYVQGVDQLKVTISATGKYGASITGYSSTVDGTSYSGSTYTTGTLAKSGAIRVTATVTDSRGWKTTVSKDITVQAYAAPTVTGVSAYRCKSASDTSSDASGAYICIKPNGSVTPLGSTNGRLCTVYWKKATEASWQSKTLSMSAYTLSGYVIVSADTAASYNICVRLQDSFRQIDYYTPDVMSASAFIDILLASETDDAKRGIAIGKVAELEDTVDLGWKLVARKSIHSDDWIECETLYSNNGVELSHKTPYVDFHYAKSTADYTARLIEMSKGVITAINSISSGSDRRLKKGIKAIDDRYMQLIEALAPKLYRYKKADGHLSAGLIAQDVLQAERQCGLDDSVLVRGTGRYIPDPKDPSKKIVDYFSIDYNCLTVLQLQYFLRRCKSLEDRIIAMEKDIAALKKEKGE